MKLFQRASRGEAWISYILYRPVATGGFTVAFRLGERRTGYFFRYRPNMKPNFLSWKVKPLTPEQEETIRGWSGDS